MLEYANNKVRGPMNRRELRAKIVEFIGHFQRIMAGRGN